MKDIIKISTDILGNKYISDAKIKPETYDFLKEEFSSFGSWCETIPEDIKDGWYSITFSS